MRSAKVAELRLDTLGPSVDYEPYVGTRAFYRTLGFVEHRRIAQPENPECEELLVLRKPL